MYAQYRKHNDHSHNSRTYHKKDGTPIRGILKQEAAREVAEALAVEITMHNGPELLAIITIPTLRMAQAHGRQAEAAALRAAGASFPGLTHMVAAGAVYAPDGQQLGTITPEGLVNWWA